MIARLRIKLNLKIIEKFMFVILLVVSKFLVMKAEHTVASYNRRDFTSKIATVSVATFNMLTEKHYKIIRHDMVSCNNNTNSYLF
jgi:hypothetical protein